MVRVCSHCRPEYAKIIQDHVVRQDDPIHAAKKDARNNSGHPPDSPSCCIPNFAKALPQEGIPKDEERAIRRWHIQACPVTSHQPPATSPPAKAAKAVLRQLRQLRDSWGKENSCQQTCPHSPRVSDSSPDSAGLACGFHHWMDWFHGIFEPKALVFTPTIRVFCRLSLQPILGT